MSLTKQDLEESEVKLGSRSKGLVPESIILKEDAEPEPELTDDKPVKPEPTPEEKPKPEPDDLEPEPDDLEPEPEDLTSLMRAEGLDKRFKSPAEVFRAYRALEADHSRINQDKAAIQRELLDIAKQLKRPPEQELDDDKLNEMFVENPAKALKLFIARQPVADKSEINSIRDEIARIEARRVANEVQTFKRSNPDYRKYESQMMEWYNEVPELQSAPIERVLPMLLLAAKGMTPVSPETNNDKKHRAETSSGGKRKTAPDTDTDYDKMSLDDLEQKFGPPQ